MKTILCMAALAVLLFGGCSSEPVPSGDKNPVLENIFARKSVRQFVARPVEPEKVEMLLRAGMAAPSGSDKRPWSFVVIEDRAQLDSLAAALPYAKMLTQSPMAIVVCGDTLRSSLWQQDCCAVTENILLAAESMGLGAVWTAAYPYAERVAAVRKHTALPENIVPLCVIPVGYPEGKQSPKEKYDSTRIHRGRWGN